MDKSTATAILAEVESAMKDILARRGLALRTRGKYDATSLTMTLEFNEQAAAGAAPVANGKAPQTARLLQYCRSYGVDPNVTWVSNGKTHRLIDYNPRAHRTPFITEATAPYIQPKNYRWTAAEVKRQQALAANKPPAMRSPAIPSSSGSGVDYSKAAQF